MRCVYERSFNPFTASLSKRVDEWVRRSRNTEFLQTDYANAMDLAKKGDLIYCDPPYTDTQSIFYGAQAFDLRNLFDVIARCKARCVFVALSMNGTKRSGNKNCVIDIPDGLFEHEATVNCGRSMLKPGSGLP
jgi:DNA adenine methylase